MWSTGASADQHLSFLKASFMTSHRDHGSFLPSDKAEKDSTHWTRSAETTTKSETTPPTADGTHAPACQWCHNTFYQAVHSRSRCEHQHRQDPRPRKQQMRPNVIGRSTAPQTLRIAIPSAHRFPLCSWVSCCASGRRSALSHWPLMARHDDVRPSGPSPWYLCDQSHGM